MKTILPLLLALILTAATGFAADQAPAAPAPIAVSALAANPPASSFVEVGKVYFFRASDFYIDKAKVLKILNDNWIQIDNNGQTQLLNLQTVSLISDESTKQ